MDPKPSLSFLVPIVALASIVGVALAVLVLVGFPMAGSMSALFSTALALTLTLSLAYVFSHATSAPPSR
jgi:hypothetical protein